MRASTRWSKRSSPTSATTWRLRAIVSYSFDDEFSTLNANINGTHFVLAALKNLAPDCRFYFAGSSEMFGKAEEVPQNEETRFHPRSSYGISKVAGFDLTRNYREAYGDARLQRHSVQSRVAAARLRICDAQDHRRGRADTRAGKSRNCGLATWTPSAIGATPGSMSRRCG